MRKMFLVLVSLLGLTSAQAAHTWHTIYTEGSSWRGRIVIASANQGGYFVNENGDFLGQLVDFNLSNDSPMTYGFDFDMNHTDFDVAYTVTVYEQGFTSKACVFNVTAAGPGTPDIRVQSFNGANCEYKPGAKGLGRDFYVS